MGILEIVLDDRINHYARIIITGQFKKGFLVDSSGVSERSFSSFLMVQTNCQQFLV